ncbi:uncharacterized protein LOC100142448 isoform X1 [Tribolium castaneum]|uniref:CCDC92/74 N-terminal domain-containing protein n=1 Tax=Tribolium castaneum TaxID=7070 RepID=A0A139WDD1_TRICA|nr:PREDICTED: uncharacterized protein LOC100142448 isoform X1 [Tribolium castaneum]XP_008194635.1 PREDICTED: uncharacterized protein LOC100142448 isoform X1 [Tribolium castaneum]KYB25959.1 hypothetical protein TcasGA2_TC015222 [Tribolium castaneum]|eukprot:XP_008194634.1 PREDICTED: uncharacterized protein LOC100142448 isoform X1 [Tribolium castaneum]
MMRHLGVQRSTSVLENSRRVPLSTIILPPLSPPLPEKASELVGKVLVNKSKSGGVNSELVAVPRSQDVPSHSPERPKGPDSARVAQLEQNIRFLQEQHQLMLTGLHNEIESLRIRNRELQFQLVFVKGTLPSSPSSPEDDSKHKVYSSPKQINITPLQVEILEKELGELKFQLQEIESRNVYLSAIVDEQKKKLERYERDREKERERALQPDPELLRKLDDAEAIIRRLRRENSDLRRENAGVSHFQMRDSTGTYKEPQKGGNQRGMGRHRGNGSGHYRGNWFPPLHSQSFWQQGSRPERNGSAENTALPNLQTSNSTQYQGRRGANNNHYHEGRKYRGQNKSTKPS